MTKVRQDAWSHEDDLLLAETVLRHVREGSTQLKAFEEVGDELNRTSAACGFRWNAEVRQKYNDAMDLAKRQRKEIKRKQTRDQHQAEKPSFNLLNHNPQQTEVHTEEPSLTLKQVIYYLQELEEKTKLTNQSKFSLEESKNENELLRNHIQTVENELSKTKQKLAEIKEDYQAFIQIMDRARKMTVLDDHGSLKAPSFRMDKNGNLEQLARGMNQ